MAHTKTPEITLPQTVEVETALAQPPEVTASFDPVAGNGADEGPMLVSGVAHYSRSHSAGLGHRTGSEYGTDFRRAMGHSAAHEPHEVTVDAPMPIVVEQVAHTPLHVPVTVKSNLIPHG